MAKLGRVLKRDFDFGMRKIAIKGANNILSELAKRRQEAKVTYELNEKTIKFIVVPKQEEISNEDIPEEEKTVLKGLKNIPIELLNQEIVNQEFSTVGIDKAMKRTQEEAGKSIQDKISKLI